MQHYDDSEYKILQMEGMPPSAFGETYVVAVGLHTSGSYYKGEYHVVSHRPAPRLESGSWQFQQSSVPLEFLTVDIAFMIEESITFARNHLIDRLIQRATELKSDRLFSEQVTLKECAGRPFVGCWIRGAFSPQLVELGERTECASLHRYIRSLSQLQAIQRN